MLKKIISSCGLGAFALLILLPGAGSPSQITRGDVTMYVLMNVMGILETGNRWVLRWNSKIDFSKPPLFHWLLAASLNFFKNPFWAFRFPPILCSAVSILLTCAFGRLLGQPRRRALLAGMLFLSCWGLFNYGRQPLLEAPFLLAVLTAMYGLTRACIKESPLWLLVFGAGFGISSMIKWGIGPLTLSLFAIAYLLWSGRWRWLLRHPFYLSAAFILAGMIALPYPVYIARHYSQEFLKQMFAQLIMERFKEPTGIPEFLSWSLLLNPLPWTLLLLPAFWNWPGLDSESKAVLGAWIISVLTPTLLIVSRTDRYAFPALPALALLVSASIDPKASEWRMSLRMTSCLAGIGLFALIGACVWLRLIPTWLVLLGAGAAVGVTVGFWGLDIASLLSASGCAAFCFMICFGVAYSDIGFNGIPPDILRTIGDARALRFDNSPEAASTGYLPLYLRRRVFIVGSNDLVQWGPVDGSMAVVSESSLHSLKDTAAKNSLKCSVLASWKNYHTSPRGSRLIEALRTRSLQPIAVTHYLTQLGR